MKVEIVEIRRKIVDIGSCADNEIDERVVDVYNNLEDKDYNFADTQMYYNVFERSAKELNVAYRTLDLAKFIIYYAHENYTGITLPMLCTIMYILYENNLKRGRKLFDGDFLSYGIYPKEMSVYNNYCMYTATMKMTPLPGYTPIDVEKNDLNEIIQYLNFYHDKNLSHIHDILSGTLYEGMVCAGMTNKKIEI